MPSSDVLPAAAQARFTTAEAQLYPLALVDADEYEQVTRVVGLLAAELRTEAPDIATVLRLREELMARVPIIAVTSYALSGDEAKTREAGCDGYIAKPFSPRQLLAKVREFLPE